MRFWENNNVYTQTQREIVEKQKLKYVSEYDRELQYKTHHLYIFLIYQSVLNTVYYLSATVICMKGIFCLHMHAYVNNQE